LTEDWSNDHQNGVQDARVSPTSDHRYIELWKTHQNLLLDPADVHATMEACMSRMTNTLSPTQVTFLQRKARSVIRASNQPQEKAGRMFRGGSSASLEQEIKSIADRYHLLSRHVVRKVLPKSPFPGDTENQDLNEDPSTNTIADNIFLLALFLHESLWDRVASKAASSAAAAGAVMDVNKYKLPDTVPNPVLPVVTGVPDLPAGISLHALTFLISLALSKYAGELVPIEN
jgi:hypothetical protein